MKFGDTLYQRSVPQWAAYNVNYNELKRLIKNHTSAGATAPVAIPGQGKSRWHNLEVELFPVVRAQYDNISLFLQSKQGEVERRLVHLEKQVRIAQRAVQDGTEQRPIVQARKYQRLVQEADTIGDDIQSLSRFASVQKTAFRKILKKYRKWTGSADLQARLDREVFSSGALQVDYTQYLQRLGILSTVISYELSTPMLTGRPAGGHMQRRRSSFIGYNHQGSRAQQLHDAASRGVLELDVALSLVPFGESAGVASYWIHPDNLDEVKTLLLRNMRDHAINEVLSRGSSTVSLLSEQAQANLTPQAAVLYHLILLDNPQRFRQDNSIIRQSRIAMSARWQKNADSVVTMTDLTPGQQEEEVIRIKRKELSYALQRDGVPSKSASNAAEISHCRSYLAEHRDVKPLAEYVSDRRYYVGQSNSSEVGTWATLDSSIRIRPADVSTAGTTSNTSDGTAFPHSILQVRWEFIRSPEILRVLDSTHLVERVDDFSIEQAAICSIMTDLPRPSWQATLEQDIRKVPMISRRSRSRRDRSRQNGWPDAPTSSGPSSTEGASDSIFSLPREQSSATSEEMRLGDSTHLSPPIQSKALESLSQPKRKHARILSPTPQAAPKRYWNEFDDGDSDGQHEEAYAIYVDPDEPMFPGAEIVSKAFGAMYDSFSRGKSRMVSWLPLQNSSKQTQNGTERTPLLRGSFFRRSAVKTNDADSSDSESEENGPRPVSRLRPKSRTFSSTSVRTSTSATYRPGQFLTKRQRALERTLFEFYTGLILLSFIILGMSGILLATGRRKAKTEVDAGIITGVVAAETCAVVSMVLIFMRKQPLMALHWTVFGLSVISIIGLGAFILSRMLTR